MGSEGSWYRITGAQRITPEDVLTSAHGRFHDDPEAEPTTYLADSLATAWREVTARFGEAQPDPKAFRAWRVTLSEVELADLRNVEDQARYEVTEAELLADPPLPRGKEVARKLRREAAGPHGLIYRSVRNSPRGVCLALFLEKEGKLLKLEPVPQEEWERFISGL